MTSIAGKKQAYANVKKYAKGPEETLVCDQIRTMGDASIGGDIEIIGAIDMGGDLDVTGNLDVGGTLGVTGNSTLSADLDVGGDLDVTGALDVGGNLDITGGNFSVSGTITSGNDLDVGNDGDTGIKAIRIRNDGTSAKAIRFFSAGVQVGNMGFTSPTLFTITQQGVGDVLRAGMGGTLTLGFFDTSPIQQPTTGSGAGAFVANTSGIVDDTATFGGYTLGQIAKALRDLGLLA